MSEQGREDITIGWRGTPLRCVSDGVGCGFFPLPRTLPSKSFRIAERHIVAAVGIRSAVIAAILNERDAIVYRSPRKIIQTQQWLPSSTAKPVPTEPAASDALAPDSAPGDSFEGDYRPAEAAGADAPPPVYPLALPNIRLEPLQVDFLLRFADALNTTLDLNTLMHRVADLVRAVIDYRIFAILLVNDRTGDLRMRFQTGHAPDVERLRIKLGRGIVGQAAAERRAILVDDVRLVENYIDANPDVRSELAVPLIHKNRVVGIIDLQSEQVGFFTEEHQRLLELTASRMAIAVENARLYTRVARQAQTLTVLNEISREITGILDLDDLLERIGLLLKRVVDFQMFTILLWNERTQQFEHRFSSRYGERVSRDHNVQLGGRHHRPRRAVAHTAAGAGRAQRPALYCRQP